MIDSNAAGKNPIDILALNLLHAGFPVRINNGGNVAVKITGWWKDVPLDVAECEHDRELLRNGYMVTAAGDRYLYMLDVVEGVYKAQNRVQDVAKTHGGIA